MKLNERKSNINLAGRMPKFKTEAEEADWWDQHEDVAVEMLQDAWPELFKVKVPTESISLRLPATQLAAVRKYAARSGVGYQTLLKRFIDIGVRSLGVGVLTHTMVVPVGVGKAVRKSSVVKTAGRIKVISAAIAPPGKAARKPSVVKTAGQKADVIEAAPKRSTLHKQLNR